MRPPRISSVDFLRREVHDRAGCGRRGLLVGGLKTTTLRRTSPVGESVIDLLAEEPAENPSADRSLPIFRTAHDGMWSPTTVATRFVIVRRDCGPPDGVSLHDLRRFYASTLIFAGASVPMVAQYLGHKSPAVTLDVYAHLWPGDDERARAAVDSVLVRDQSGTGDRTGTTPTTE